MSRKLKNMFFVATDLEAAGISITSVSAPYSCACSILIYAHNEAFRKWAQPKLERITFTELDIGPDNNRWEVSLEMGGVLVHGYITDDEKEAFDGDPV